MANIIVAFSTKNFGIGFNNKLPWSIPEDLARFKALTLNKRILMGYNTWMSLPIRPLPGRINIVVSREYIELNGAEVVTYDQLDDLELDDLYVIGGVSLYKKFMGQAQNIYATLIDQEFECDTFFPICQMHQYKIESFKNSNSACVSYIKYVKNEKKHDEYNYLDLLDKIMQNGEDRPDRTETGTKSIFAPNPLRFDISSSIPIFTTKQVSYKTIIKELLWFLKGQTNSKILEADKINIWKGNTSREFLDNRGLTYDEGDIGSMYGWIWRHIGAEYKGCNADYNGEGIDQLANLIEGLRADPFGRRHLLTTYCPLYNDSGVLLPCHGIVTQFYVREGGLLSCHVYNRSQDMLLGQPFNITSYAVLTYIIAQKTNMKPDSLIVSMGDAHIYSNHYEQVRMQLTRSPLPFPKLIIKNEKSLEDLTIDDFNIVGYLHHPKIIAKMAI
jgi:dihydrofolate reductase/thymidylate synthase